MKYRMLAIDVDGTLTGPEGVVAGEVVEAILAGRRAGLAICLATGRSRAETLPVWRQLRLPAPHLPLVVVGGAMVAEADGGRTLYQRPIPGPVAQSLAKALAEEGYCAMALVDVWRHGVDYLLVRGGDMSAARKLWLEKTGATVREVDDLDGSPAVLRINTVAARDEGEKLAEQLRRRFEGQLNIHAILAPNYGVFVVEAHAAGADKFTAIRYVAQGVDIVPGGIVAVGDDVNDLAMIRGAALGVVMPKAPMSLQQAAGHVAQNGLAVFIRELIAGKFDEYHKYIGEI